jgi:ABC-type Fe3+-siderophore transport system permease subunit
MTRKRTAVLFISIVGAIHLVLAPEYLGEKPYIGALFLAGAAGCALVAVLLGRDGRDRRAWALGTLISLGMGVGFVLSRTVGLPGFHESEWEVSGIVTLVAEAGFVGLAAPALARVRPRARAGAGAMAR